MIDHMLILTHYCASQIVSMHMLNHSQQLQLPRLLRLSKVCDRLVASQRASLCLFCLWLAFFTLASQVLNLLQRIGMHTVRLRSWQG